MNNWFLKVPSRYWAYLALTIWGILSLLLLNKTPYGINEGGARALLLVWSIVDNVVSPIITSGLPDFRTIFLAPVGFFWPGNILAAKIFTLLVMSCAVWSIHTWRQRSGNSESALLGSGLLLISPLTINQIDTISVAPYLLVTFALGAWTDKIYRENPLAFGGKYFSQLFLCFISTSLHPAGLAYPLALLWRWHKNPVARQRNYFSGAVIFSVMFALMLTLGWQHVEWFTNPFRSLSSLVLGPSASKDIDIIRWTFGIGVFLILMLVIWKQASSLSTDFLGHILLCALAIGVLVGDESWAIIALAICFYWGFSLLLLTSTASSDGFWGRRGITLLLLFLISTTFMVADKAQYQKAVAGELAPRDSLIKALVDHTQDTSSNTPRRKPSELKSLVVASQWPGATMLACRCGVFPLPPPATDEQELLAMLRSIKYLIFDPRDPKNSSLSRNLAIMNAGKVETVALQEGGVIVAIKETAPPADIKGMPTQ